MSDMTFNMTSSYCNDTLLELANRTSLTFNLVTCVNASLILTADNSDSYTKAIYEISISTAARLTTEIRYIKRAFNTVPLPIFSVAEVT